jgi:hypothetical protein
MSEADTEDSFVSRTRIAFTLGSVWGCAKGEIAELIAVVIERFRTASTHSLSPNNELDTRIFMISLSV